MHLLRERPVGATWEVIFLEEGPMVDEVGRMGWEATVVPAGRARDVHRLQRTVRAISSIARSNRAETILGWMAKSNLYAGPAAVLAGIPGVWYQVDAPKFGNPLGRVAMAMPANGVITNSKTIEQQQQRIWPRRRTRVVYPGVDGTIFNADNLPSPQSARSQLGLPPDGPLIGMVGRLQRWKGMHSLVQAMPAVLREHPGANCVIVGGPHPFEPDYPAFLDSVIKDCAVKDRVLLTGYQPNVEMWMQAMDIVVHASREEPFGLVVLEAMALGKPVIAANSGGPVEIITDGVQGVLFSYGDSEALGRAIRRFVNDPGFAERVSKAGHSRALDFTTDRYASNLVAAIKDLVGARQ